MTDVPKIFGELVFNDETMRARLPKEIYKALKKTIEEGKTLDLSLANAVASAMKDWAMEKGATHFTHWFQPLNGVTAEKHDSFISPVAGGGVVMEFSGKELIRGETDASSFPSGGLRATFEARGYTAWDPTSYAFIKDGVLCIPTAFCSYSGDALDQKTPLLRSMDAISRQAVRVLRLFGREAEYVRPTVGPEQEYFLIDRDVYLKRKDLIYTGRTLFGADPPKGQQLEDHFFGTIKPRVGAFMKELDEELWRLGVLSKTEHNEVAPAQHEMAPVFSTTNLSTDHNQLTMETLKKVALRHNMVCLLHEKPFAGVNGSGKHNNWSLTTDKGENLLDPGSTPYDNAQFLLFLCAVIKAVDEHQDLLRVSVATAGNDHRMGEDEAPPFIMSMFLGDELSAVLEALESGSGYAGRDAMEMELGVDALPHFPKDNTDRNRTSPFAFTGNKFEFRSLGASASIAMTNTVLNTIVADELMSIADQLEKAEDFSAALKQTVVDIIKAHKRIIFNGNNYSPKWVEEAARRGLLNVPSTPEALPLLLKEENAALFARHHVLNSSEIHSRYEILMENYCKVLIIEATCMCNMVRKSILPAVIEYSRVVAETALTKKQLSEDIDTSVEEALVKRISSCTTQLNQRLSELLAAIHESESLSDVTELGLFLRREVFFGMERLRAVADELELLVAKKYWPFPTYGDILYSVQ